MTEASALPGQPRGGVFSGTATPRAVNVLAPNASAMTLDGTNTWIVAEPDSELAVVIDPGPLDDVHLRNVVDTAEKAGKRVALTLLTHGHPDHAEGAARFAELSGTAVRALDPALRLGDEGLGDGDVVEVGDVVLRVVGTPGHTSDSLSFLLEQPGARPGLLTGDTVLGRGTTVVAHPDGRLGPYLDSLQRLLALVEGLDADGAAVLPGHGPLLDDAGTALRGYLAHRAQRLDQVRAAVAAGDMTARQVVERVYADVDEVLWPAAELSVRAQLEHLRELGG